MQGLIRRRGIPLALYTDRHAVFKHRSEYQPAGTTTQFGRAMEELGTQLIFARSPQAKGRVERTAGNLPGPADHAPAGPADHGATACGSNHRCTGQGRVAAVPAPVQPAFRGPGPVRRVRIPARGAGSRVFVWVRSCVSSTAGEWRGTIP